MSNDEQEKVDYLDVDDTSGQNYVYLKIIEHLEALNHKKHSMYLSCLQSYCKEQEV